MNDWLLMKELTHPPASFIRLISCSEAFLLPYGLCDSVKTSAFPEREITYNSWVENSVMISLVYSCFIKKNCEKQTKKIAYHRRVPDMWNKHNIFLHKYSSDSWTRFVFFASCLKPCTKLKPWIKYHVEYT